MPGWINTKEMEIKSISPVPIKSKSNATSIGVYKSDLPFGDKTFTLYFPDVEIISGYADSYNEDTGEAEEFPFDSVGHFYHYTFSASGIENISFRWSGSTNVEVYTGTYESEADFAKDQLPFNFYNGSAVVYNGEIHILGGGINNTTDHYKWNGEEWTSVSELPFNFYRGSAVVYNGEIHILGGSGNEKKHYKWNSTDGWTSVSTLPYSFINGGAIVYNDEIHILGGEENETKHYKWDEKEWTEVSTLLYEFSRGSAVVYNGEIHILGSQFTSGLPGRYYYNQNKHYKWNGEEWTKVSDLPYHFSNGSAVVYSEYIYLIGGDEDDKAGSQLYFRWDGEKWEALFGLPYDFYNGSAVAHNNSIYLLGGQDSPTSMIYLQPTYAKVKRAWLLHKAEKSYSEEVSELPYEFSDGAAVVYKDTIHILGSDSPDTTYHYVWDGEGWDSSTPLPYAFYRTGAAVVYKDAIHILGSAATRSRTKHYKWIPYEGWSEVSTIPYSVGGYASAVVYNDEIHVLGGSVNSKYHYKWNGTSWTEVSTLPYAFTDGAAVVYNNEIHILGGEFSSYKHYKWNGEEWVEVSTLPFDFFYSNAAVVYDNEIYIYNDFNAAKWSGEEWIELPEMSHQFSGCSAVVYNDEIHILGRIEDSLEKHYKIVNKGDRILEFLPTVYVNDSNKLRKGLQMKENWNDMKVSSISVYFASNLIISGYYTALLFYGTTLYEVYPSWGSSSSSLPYNSTGAAAVHTDDGIIHLFGGSSSATIAKYYYQISSSGNTKKTNIPYNFANGFAVVYNDEIHILGGLYSSTVLRNHYKWTGSAWTSVSPMPNYNFYGNRCSAVVYDGEIWCISGFDEVIFKWNGEEWTTYEIPLPSLTNLSFLCSVVYDDKLHLFITKLLGSAGGSGNYRTYHYVLDKTHRQWIEKKSPNHKIVVGAFELGDAHQKYIFGGDALNGTAYLEEYEIDETSYN